MTYHSQNRESEISLKYFNGRKGIMLDIGANDGITLSNSYDLIKEGWDCYCLEPSSVFKDLQKLHVGNPNVGCCNFGIGEREERVKFFESGAHVPNGHDKALVSSTKYEETVRWRNSGVEFEETEIQLMPFKKFWESVRKPKFNLISIDTEGTEISILKQINLKEVGCEMLIIEFNGVIDLKKAFTNYCRKFNMELIHQNSENLVFAKSR